MNAALRRDLPSLTGLRFYAALAVLLRHTVLPFLPVPVLTQLAVIGPIGVGFFFVLSGFVLAWAWNPTASKGNFWVNRFARVYPLHILLTAAAVAIVVIDGSPQWTAILLSVLLIQSWFTDQYKFAGNDVSWSLSCEAFFYACFPFLAPVISRLTVRRALWVIPVVIAAMGTYTVAYAVLLVRDVSWASAVSTYTNPAYRIGEFVIGICVAVAVRQGFRLRVSTRLALTAAALSYAALAAMNWAVSRSGLNIGGEVGLPLGVLDLLYLPVTVLLIAAMASSDVEGMPSPVSGYISVKLGQWSFALYLVQMLVINNVERVIPDDLGAGIGVVTFLATIGTCVAAAAVLHEFVERRANLWLRGRAAGRRIRPDETISAR